MRPLSTESGLMQLLRLKGPTCRREMELESFSPFWEPMQGG